MRHVYRLFGWPDSAVATLAIALYSFMSIAFVVLAFIVATSGETALGAVRLALLAILLTVHIVLHWFGLRLLAPGDPKARLRRVAYAISQAGLVFALSALTTSLGLTLGLWVTLLAETAALLWPEWRSIVLSSCFYLALMALDMTLVWSFEELMASLPMIGLLFGGILLYALLLVREGWTRQKAETLVRELEAAKRQLQEYSEKVEELTISQERQRMAREMHDTLAQGLAGVIFQLEAADSHMERNRLADAQVSVRQAMQRARQTLHEARRAIQALRSAALEEKDLVAAITSEISEFEATAGVAADLILEGDTGPISPRVAQHVLRIVQESLSNVGRHARARQVQIRLARNGHKLQLVVQDDGKGFDVQAAMQRQDCFGLQGMHERAARMGAELRVESPPQGGTRLVLSWESVAEPPLGPDQGARGDNVNGAVARVEAAR